MPTVTPVSISPISQGDSVVKSMPVSLSATDSLRTNSRHSVEFSNCKPTSNSTVGETRQEMQQSLVSEASTDSIGSLKIQSVYSLAGLDQITKEHSYSQDPSALRSREDIAASALLSFTTVAGEDDGSLGGGGGSPSKLSESEVTNSSLLSVGPPPSLTLLESPDKSLVADVQEESSTEKQLEQNAVSEMIVGIENVSELNDQEAGIASTGVEEVAPSIETASALSNGELGSVAESTSELRPECSVEKQESMSTTCSGASPGDASSSSPKARQQESANREETGTQNHQLPVTDPLPPANTGSENSLSDGADDLRGSESKRAKVEVESTVGSDRSMEQGAEDIPLSENETKSTGTPVTCISESMPLTCALTASPKSPSPVTSEQQSMPITTASPKSPSPVTSEQQSMPITTASPKSPSPVTSEQQSVPITTASPKSPSPVTSEQQSMPITTASPKSPSPVTSEQQSVPKTTASPKSPSPVTSEQQTPASPSQSPVRSTFDSSSPQMGQQEVLTEESVRKQLYATTADSEVDDLREPEPKRIKLDVENADHIMKQGTEDIPLSTVRTTGGTDQQPRTTTSTVTSVCETECTGITPSVKSSSENAPLTCTTTASQGVNGPVAGEEQSLTFTSSSRASTTSPVEHDSCMSVPNCGSTVVSSSGLRTAAPSISLLNPGSSTCASSSTVTSSTAATPVEHNARTCVPSCGDRSTTGGEQRTTILLPDPIITSAATAVSSGVTSSVAGNVSTLVSSCSAGTSSSGSQTSRDGAASYEARAPGNVSLENSELKQGTKRMCLWDDCSW